MEEKLPDAVWEQLRDLSCPTEKVTGLKIKLIPNPSCWLYFGRKSFSHWRQNWIFIMGFEMDPKSSELHIWSKTWLRFSFTDKIPPERARPFFLALLDSERCFFL